MIGWGFRHHHHHGPLSRVPLVTVVEAPEPFVTIEEMNARLRLDLDFDSPVSDDDQMVIDDVTAMISAAISSLDGPSGSIGRALAPQTLELSVHSRCERHIELLYPPVIAVDMITYADSSGEQQALDASAYRLVRGAVYFPAGAPHSEDLRIRYRAGYSTQDSPDAEAVPTAIKQAVRLMVGDMWQFRESAAPNRVTAIESSATVQALVAPFKIYAV